MLTLSSCRNDGSGSVPVTTSMRGAFGSPALQSLILDFACFQTPSFSRASLGVPAYVMDPRFRIFGLTVVYPDGHALFHSDIPPVLRDLRGRYGAKFEKVRVAMHDAALEYFILNKRYGQEVAHPVCVEAVSRSVNSPDQLTDQGSLASFYGLKHFRIAGLINKSDPTPGQLNAMRGSCIKRALMIGELTGKLLGELTAPQLQLPAIGQTIRMFVEKPLRIDIGEVEKGVQAVADARDAIIAMTGHTWDEISGDKSFGDLLNTALARTGRAIPMKPGRKGLIPAIARDDEEARKLLSDNDPVVANLMRGRFLVTSIPAQQGRLAHLEKHHGMCRGKLHPELLYHKAHHGRFAGGSGFNIQNLKKAPSTGDTFTEGAAFHVRRSLRASNGCVLVSSDACQIEARILAWMARQRDLHDAFAGGRDVYSEFASEVFRRPVRKPQASDTDADLMRMLRKVGKTAILGLGYGMGVRRFIQTLHTDPDGLRLFDKGLLDSRICANLVHGYRERYPTIPTLWSIVEQAFRDALRGRDTTVGPASFSGDGPRVRVMLPSGRVITYVNAREVPAGRSPREFIDRNGMWKSFTPEEGNKKLLYSSGHTLFGGKLVEHIVSGTACDVLTGCILQLEAEGRDVVGHIHDEVVCEVEDDSASVVMCQEAMEAAWRKVPAWAEGLVLDAETHIGPNLGDLN